MDSATAVAPVRRSLAEIKAALAKSKESAVSKEVETLEASIADIETDLKMVSSREHAALMQTKVLNTELDDAASTLAEIRQNREILEDAESLIADCEATVADVKLKIEKSKNEIDALVQEKSKKCIELRTLKERHSNLTIHKDLDILIRTRDHRPEAGNERKFSDVSKKLLDCRTAIQRLYREACDCSVKLTLHPSDKAARTFIIEDIAAQLRMFQAEPEFHNLIPCEREILYNANGKLRMLSKQFGVYYIDAFSPNQRPKDFSNWTEYALDVKKQMEAYFSNPEAPKPQSASFGVIKPAAVINPAPAQQAVQTSLPKPKEEKKVSPDRIFAQAVAASGLLKKTEGLRLALISSLPDKDGLTSFLEDVLSLKRFSWYEVRTNDDLINSIKASGIDLLLAVPKWHKGFKYYTTFAKKNGIESLVLTEHGKYKIVQQIAEYFGIALECPI